MLDKGEPWEHGYVQEKVLGLLKEAATLLRAEGEFAALRGRLIELGRHGALDIVPGD
jgi:hypothetical protein